MGSYCRLQWCAGEGQREPTGVSSASQCPIVLCIEFPTLLEAYFQRGSVAYFVLALVGTMPCHYNIPIATNSWLAMQSATIWDLATLRPLANYYHRGNEIQTLALWT